MFVVHLLSDARGHVRSMALRLLAFLVPKGDPSLLRRLALPATAPDSLPEVPSSSPAFHC